MLSAFQLLLAFSDTVIESFRLEKTFKIKCNLTLPSPPLNHVPKHHIYTFIVHVVEMFCHSSI